jgi:2-hydroxy-3-keto-5-methylthiopentenyl-1-phosphate phosphatase
MNNNVIICDFDGTITREDTVDKLLEKYATDDWIFFENLWLENKIGSRECLERQINCIHHFSNKDLKEFIDSVEIDEHFPLLLKEIKELNLELYIVSDGFDLFISKILKKYGINNIKIFSNLLYLDNSTLKPIFPFCNKDCIFGSGLCKCSILKELAKGRQVVYIGDGKSDFCVSRHADIIFAKGKLADHCRDNNLCFYEFQDFNDIKVRLLLKEGIDFVKNGIID